MSLLALGAIVVGVAIAIGYANVFGTGVTADVALLTVVVVIDTAFWRMAHRPGVPTIAYAVVLWFLVVVVPYGFLAAREILVDAALLLGLAFCFSESLAGWWIGLFRRA